MKVRTASMLTHGQSKKIKMEMGNRCDRCGLQFPLYILDIVSTHPGESAQMPSPDSLLILCVNCRVAVQMGRVPDHEIHEMQVRPPETRKKIAEILLRTYAPYTPPDTFELDEIFESANEIGTLDLFLNGA